MTLLFKTTNEQEALKYEMEAGKKYGLFRIYRFQYRAADGNFYYEILLADE